MSQGHGVDLATQQDVHPDVQFNQPLQKTSGLVHIVLGFFVVCCILFWIGLWYRFVSQLRFVSLPLFLIGYWPLIYNYTRLYICFYMDTVYVSLFLVGLYAHVSLVCWCSMFVACSIYPSISQVFLCCFRAHTWFINQWIHCYVWHTNIGWWWEIPMKKIIVIDIISFYCKKITKNMFESSHHISPFSHNKPPSWASFPTSAAHLSHGPRRERNCRTRFLPGQADSGHLPSLGKSTKLKSGGREFLLQGSESHQKWSKKRLLAEKSRISSTLICFKMLET